MCFEYLLDLLCQHRCGQQCGHGNSSVVVVLAPTLVFVSSPVGSLV
jgi:hypothetical protein